MLKTFYRNINPFHIRKSIEKYRRSLIPFLKKRYVYCVDHNVKYATQRLTQLHNLFEGQRCFIMGNGPSLNKMDLSLFKNEYVWSSNKSYLLFDRINWRPKFYIAVDKRVVPDIAMEIDSLIRILPDTYFIFPVYFREHWILNSRKNVYFYKEICMDESNLPDGVFSIDASLWVSSVRTVTIAALQLAVYVGFNPIYLIGCDTDYQVPSTIIFEGNNPNKLISTKNDDINHFAPNYFGKGSRWHQPYVDRMIEHYHQAKLVCDRMGVKVYNATVGGKLEVFPRVGYRSLFV